MKAADFEFLAFRQTVYHLYIRMFEPVLARYGLTQMEMDLLLFLSNHPGYDTAAELVAVRHLSKSQVSVSVEDLVCRNLLERTPDAENRRMSHLKATAAADELVRAGRGCQRTFFNTLLRGVNEEERRQLTDVLRRVTDNAREGCRESGKKRAR